MTAICVRKFRLAGNEKARSIKDRALNQHLTLRRS